MQQLYQINVEKLAIQANTNTAGWLYVSTYFQGHEGRQINCSLINAGIGNSLKLFLKQIVSEKTRAKDGSKKI